MTPGRVGFEVRFLGLRLPFLGSSRTTTRVVFEGPDAGGLPELATWERHEASRCPGCGGVFVRTTPAVS